MGQQGEAALPASSLESLPPTHVARRQANGRPRPAQLSQFTLGRLWLMRTIVEREPFVQGRFAPTPWPQELPTLRRQRTRTQQKKSRAQRKRWQRQHRARQKQEAQSHELKNLPM